MYKILVDNHKFFLSEKSLNNYPNNILTKIIKKQINNYNRIHFDSKHNKLYIDADPNSFQIIITYLRGYSIDIDSIDENIRTKVYSDAIYFEFNDLRDSFDKLDQNNKQDNIQTQSNEDYEDTNSNYSIDSKTSDEIYEYKPAYDMSQYIDNTKLNENDMLTTINKISNNDNIMGFLKNLNDKVYNNTNSTNLIFDMDYNKKYKNKYIPIFTNDNKIE